jgi:hypothetical protein
MRVWNSDLKCNVCYLILLAAITAINAMNIIKGAEPNET